MFEAASRDPQAILQELSGDLMSPYCPGRTISSCPSQAARKLEDEILAQAKQGKTRDQIEAGLVERFGNDIIGYRPPPYLIGGTVVTGLIVLGFLLRSARRWVRHSPSPASTTPTGDATGGPSRADLDALDDALDEEDGF